MANFPAFFCLVLVVFVEAVFVNANGIHVTECTYLATPAIAKYEEILGSLNHCINNEVNHDDKGVALLSTYIHSQLGILADFHRYAKNCVARFVESEKTFSDTAEAFACISPLRMSVQFFLMRIEFITDIELARNLFNDYETRIKTCTSTASRKLDSPFPTAHYVYKEILRCVAKENQLS